MRGVNEEERVRCSTWTPYTDKLKRLGQVFTQRAFKQGWTTLEKLKKRGLYLG